MPTHVLLLLPSGLDYHLVDPVAQHCFSTLLSESDFQIDSCKDCCSFSSKTANKAITVLYRETKVHKNVTLWDLTSDRLLAAMLMLGRNFPLHQALNGHRLAAFVVEQHKV